MVDKKWKHTYLNWQMYFLEAEHVYITSILSSSMCFAFECLLLKHLQYFRKSNENDNFYIHSTHKHYHFNWMCIQVHHHYQCIILGDIKTRSMKIHLTRHKSKQFMEAKKKIASISNIYIRHHNKHHNKQDKEAWGNHHKKHYNKQDMEA
jgi:hypothetical protein